VTAPADERRFPPPAADERATLQGFLDHHRDTLMWKCAGLSAGQLTARPLPTTNLSLLGLVRHLAEVERDWFRRSAAGEDVPPIFTTDEERDRDIDPPADADPEADVAVWRAETAACDAAVRDRGLEDTFPAWWGSDVSMRWLYGHLIEEYARHNGHADLLRQAIDGATGE
jgi:uncharacterized damage-inducible protein DinB